MLKKTITILKKINWELLLASLTLMASMYIWQADGTDDDKKESYSIYFDYLKARGNCLNKNECEGLDELSIVTAERILSLTGDDIGWKNTISHIYNNKPEYFTQMECFTLSSELIEFFHNNNIPLDCR
ncbi:hypothetical protein [Photobacterium leiognathi]|uniref:hypothetical protein n=1 Tax=Photobacterium leiognathi TaxID=553611 RepID=UPI0029821676|nr:hypothetical protein [Photobacterium leiognathi]